MEVEAVDNWSTEDERGLLMGWRLPRDDHGGVAGKMMVVARLWRVGGGMDARVDGQAGGVARAAERAWRTPEDPHLSLWLELTVGEATVIKVNSARSTDEFVRIINCTFEHESEALFKPVLDIYSAINTENVVSANNIIGVTRVVIMDSILKNYTMVDTSLVRNINSILMIQNSRIEAITAGTGVLNEGGKLFLYSSVLKDNVGTEDGFVHITGDGLADVRNTLFQGNSGKSGGALSLLYNGGAELYDSTFRGNSAIQGGVVYLSQGNGRSLNCIFQDNFAEHGGVVYSTSSTFAIEMSNSIFRGNRARKYGGAVYAEDILTVVSCTFHDNAATHGAALYLTVESSSQFYLKEIAYDNSNPAELYWDPGTNNYDTIVNSTLLYQPPDCLGCIALERTDLYNTQARPPTNLSPQWHSWPVRAKLADTVIVSGRNSSILEVDLFDMFDNTAETYTSLDRSSNTHAEISTYTADSKYYVSENCGIAGSLSALFEGGVAQFKQAKILAIPGTLCRANITVSLYNDVTGQLYQRLDLSAEFYVRSCIAGEVYNEQAQMCIKCQAKTILLAFNSQDKTCETCENEAGIKCLGGNEFKIENGYYLAKSAANAATPKELFSMVQECDIPAACTTDKDRIATVSSLADFSERICNLDDGYTTIVLCGGTSRPVCKEGYYVGTDGAHCAKCASRGAYLSTFLISAIGVILLIAIAYIAYLLFIGRLELKLSRWALKKKNEVQGQDSGKEDSDGAYTAQNAYTATVQANNAQGSLTNNPKGTSDGSGLPVPGRNIMVDPRAPAEHTIDVDVSQGGAGSTDGASAGHAPHAESTAAEAECTQIAKTVNQVGSEIGATLFATTEDTQAQVAVLSETAISKGAPAEGFSKIGGDTLVLTETNAGNDGDVPINELNSSHVPTIDTTNVPPPPDNPIELLNDIRKNPIYYEVAKVMAYLSVQVSNILGYIQVVSQFASIYTGDILPSVFAKWVNSMPTFRLNLTTAISLECFFYHFYPSQSGSSNFWTAYYQAVATPWIVVLLATFAYFARICYLSTKNKPLEDDDEWQALKRKTQRSITASAMFVLNLTHASVATSTLQIFSCDKYYYDEDEKQFFLRLDSSVECSRENNKDYAEGIYYAWFTICVYLIGYPVSIFAYMYYSRMYLKCEVLQTDYDKHEALIEPISKREEDGSDEAAPVSESCTLYIHSRHFEPEKIDGLLASPVDSALQDGNHDDEIYLYPKELLLADGDTKKVCNVRIYLKKDFMDGGRWEFVWVTWLNAEDVQKTLGSSFTRPYEDSCYWYVLLARLQATSVSSRVLGAVR
ncbi:hypothetical protein CYMTET_50119 [Cymbomonas tetramitiformis]|uniref:Right handed beta helix domain-containing protein n=1 Tax=Cymbomonas tetramitiformis TaxID=36881 RepID=A0AAE0ETU1_9CHLO|nr:hypothetical protein CYMTET_50119 [Cymbomonas tetramitiformis]